MAARPTWMKSSIQKLLTPSLTAMNVPIKAATMPMTRVISTEMSCLPRIAKRPRAPMMAPMTMALMMPFDVILSFVQGGAVANAWRTTLQGRRHVGHPRSQIHLHPAICALHGGEAAAPVDLVRIPGGEKETCYTVGRKILNDALYQPSIQPSSAVWLSDENVTDPGKRGRVGDNAREGRLLFLGVHGVGTRSGD